MDKFKSMRKSKDIYRFLFILMLTGMIFIWQSPEVRNGWNFSEILVDQNPLQPNPVTRTKQSPLSAWQI
jgi:hypothetical protein